MLAILVVRPPGRWGHPAANPAIEVSTDPGVLPPGLATLLHTPPPPGRSPTASAFAAIARRRADGLYVWLHATMITHRGRIVDFAARNRLPAVYESREFADAGGLMTYGVDNHELYRRAATYVDRILRGAKPADLPVEQPNTFELVISTKRARALGLTIPPSLLLRADELIK